MNIDSVRRGEPHFNRINPLALVVAYHRTTHDDYDRLGRREDDPGNRDGRFDLPSLHVTPSGFLGHTSRVPDRGRLNWRESLEGIGGRSLWTSSQILHDHGNRFATTVWPRVPGLVLP